MTATKKKKKKKKSVSLSSKRRRRIIKLTRQTSDEDIMVFNKLAMRNYRKFITDLSNVVIERRKKLGMSVLNLSQRIGVHFHTIYKLEAQGKVEAESLFQICTYLDIDIRFNANRMMGERKYVVLKEEMMNVVTPNTGAQEVATEES